MQQLVFITKNKKINNVLKWGILMYFIFLVAYSIFMSGQNEICSDIVH